VSDAEYRNTRFSVTVETRDAAVLHVLRALSQYCYGGKYKQIAWGGTGEKQWLADNHEVTFRFQSDSERRRFVAERQRLLDSSLWRVIATDDNNEATKQRG
jgi:hypothetical protein